MLGDTNASLTARRGLGSQALHEGRPAAQHEEAHPESRLFDPA